MKRYNISAAITFPGGQCCVSGGNFKATFNLNSPTGKLKGRFHSHTTEFHSCGREVSRIPLLQPIKGAWILTVSGTDSYGNSGMTYSWLNVGLNVLLSTDSPGYIIGDTMTILAAPEYPNGQVTAQGNFTAVVTSETKTGLRRSSNVQLAVQACGLEPSHWQSHTRLAITRSPVGGDDGYWQFGKFCHDNSSCALPFARARYNSQPDNFDKRWKRAVSDCGKSAYPNGTAMKTGSVEAFVSLDMDGVFTPIGHAE